MTVTRTEMGVIALTGICPNEDAEHLQRYLLETPGVKVDWRGCEGLHTAVVQVLLAAAPVLLGPPQGPLLEKMIEPLLQRRAAE